MLRVDHEVVVRRPAAEVFDYLTDLDTLTEWQASVVEVSRLTDGPVRVGTRFTESRSLMGRAVESMIEVTEYEPGERFSLRVLSGPVRFTVTHTLEPHEDGTRLEIHGEGEAHGLARMAGSLVTRRARQEFESDFGRLKQLLESRSSGATTTGT